MFFQIESLNPVQKIFFVRLLD